LVQLTSMAHRWRAQPSATTACRSSLALAIQPQLLLLDEPLSADAKCADPAR
jgi:ABC-type sulfate/molybdate transport systems ATPase subunit